MQSQPLLQERPPRSRSACLFALSAEERLLFFPGMAVEEALPCGGVHREISRSGAAREWRELLDRVAPSVVLTSWSTPPLPKELACDPGSPLRYICHLTGSVRRMVPREFIERGGLVSNWGGEISHAVAEHALLLALSALRNSPMWRPFVEQGGGGLMQRCRQLKTRSLRGRRVGIHGCGSVARALIGLLAPFQVAVHAHSAGVAPEFIRSRGALPCPSLRELFTRSEVLFECEALTPATANSITREMLSLLPRDAVFVNVARGALVDEEALAALAAEGRLRAGLDVLRNEPVSADSVFWKTPNVVLSPHIGGPTHDLYPQCGRFALENIRRYLSGSMPQALVDLETYDRTT